MTSIQKIKSFEYLVSKLIDWSLRKNPTGNYKKDFTTLKLTKLLFFVSAAQANKNQEGLLNVFDNFWAMPFGHVESDIYNSINENSLNLYDIQSTGILNKEAPAANYFNEIGSIKGQIEDSLFSLLEYNPDIIDLTAFDLVELSHNWQSWKSIFSLAQSQQKRSLKIPKLMIQLEPKIFTLN